MKQQHLKQTFVWTITLLTAVVIFMGSPTAIMAKTDDVILQAMKDELDRSMTSLKIENMEKPYYIEYSLWDNWELSIEGNFGALTNSRENRLRTLKVGVRVGGYQLDNTGFMDRSSLFSTVMGRHEQVVIEDDYNAIRRDIWLATDSAYKDALQQLASKKAYIKNQVQTEEIPDFSKEESVQKIAPPIKLEVDREKWEKIVTQLSAVFRQFPAIQESQVNMNIGVLNKYYVNSEGTMFCQPQTSVSLVANAAAQAADGMKLKHYIPFYATSPQQMPSEKELTDGIKKMAEELTALASAPVLEEYIGPVLFTQQASAELFTQVLAPHLSGERPPLSNIPQNYGITTFSSKLTQRLNRKILPREISIIDNPLQTEFNQEPLIGAYNIDDEGAAAKPVNLVEKGNLKALLMSRRPRKEITQSNGHGRSSLMGNPGTQIGNLLITADTGKTYQELEKELLGLCTDQGLEFGLIIKTLDNPAITGMASPGFGPGSLQTEPTLTTPVMVTRVYVKDGREELVRGLTVSELPVSRLDDIAAVGNDYYVLNRMVSPAGLTTGSIFFFYIARAGTSMTIPASIVAPSVLFEELEFKKSEEKRETTPLLTHPFFGK